MNTGIYECVLFDLDPTDFLLHLYKMTQACRGIQWLPKSAGSAAQQEQVHTAIQLVLRVPTLHAFGRRF